MHTHSVGALTAAGVLTFALVCPAEADTDIAGFLNAALATKNKVARVRSVPSRVWSCDDFGGGGINNRCRWVSGGSRPETYVDTARVRNTQVLEVRDLSFQHEKITGLPENALLARVDYYNCGPGVFSTSETLSVSGTRGWTVTKTSTIGSTFTVGLADTFTYGYSSTTLSFSQSISLSSSTSGSESVSIGDSRSVNASISIQHGEAGYLEMLVYQTTAEVPFTATVMVDGDLEDNVSGFTKASALLSASERSIQFSGNIRVTGMSEAKVGNSPPNIPFACAADKTQTYRSGPSHRRIPAEDLSDEYKKRFSSAGDAATFIDGRIGEIVERTATKLMEVSAPTPNTITGAGPILPDPNIVGPSIGRPNGTTFTVVSTSTMVKPTPACGFNDLSLPNMGTFLVQGRQYETWLDGMLVATWPEQVETFQSCLAGP
jgi:hypothetical protein